MTLLNLAKRVFGASVATAILVACASGFQRFAPTSSASLPSNIVQRVNWAVRLQDDVVARDAGGFASEPNPEKSWMAKIPKGTPLVYVSNIVTNDIYVYTYPRLALVGTLAGFFSHPQGECADKAGDVWIASTNRQQLLEFAHGGLDPIATLKETGYFPVGCSVSPTSGDLAVVNLKSNYGGPGSISIFKNASGNPTVFAYPDDIYLVYFDGYDSHGNLFFDGFDDSLTFQIAEIKDSNVTGLTLSGATINFPGAVVARGQSVNVEEQESPTGGSVMYQTTLSGTTLTVNAAAQFQNANDCAGTSLFGGKKSLKAICPNNDGSASTVNVYKYSRGGMPTKSVTTPSSPVGSVVSP